jgi:hypothetical protein
MLRSGGVVTDNLFVGNPIQCSLGGGFPIPKYMGEGFVNTGVDATFTGNVVLGAGPAYDPWGLIMSNIRSSVIENNIFANAEITKRGTAIYLQGVEQGFDARSSGLVGILGTVIKNNGVYKHGVNLKIEGNLFDVDAHSNVFSSNLDGKKI